MILTLIKLFGSFHILNFNSFKNIKKDAIFEILNSYCLVFIITMILLKNYRNNICKLYTFLL